MVHLIAARFSEEFASDLFLGFALAIRFQRAHHDNLKRLFSLFTRVFRPRCRRQVVKWIRAILVRFLLKKFLARHIKLRLSEARLMTGEKLGALHLDWSVVETDLALGRLISLLAFTLLLLLDTV